ncbi:MAG: hypothetical protein JWR67_3137 [Mucilaginibacter sp.]|nr:hypothetical protein [Mucilaginibacter sp.]
MIHTSHLFPILDQKLIELLRSLKEEDWAKPTLAKLWTVKDIAAHLLDTNIRTLATRDNYFTRPDREIHSYQDLVAYLNHLNAVWVAAAKRISPKVLTDFLEITGKQHAASITALDLTATAPVPVAWAGEQTSKMWFHVAREYTEKWHHQQQIRDAVGIQGIMTRELFFPCIDTFMCGLPHTYRNTTASVGTVIQIIINTEIGGNWFLAYNGNNWDLTKDPQPNPTALISIPPDIAWKLFSKGITAAEAKQHVSFAGDAKLAEVVLNLLAVMA